MNQSRWPLLRLFLIVTSNVAVFCVIAAWSFAQQRKGSIEIRPLGAFAYVYFDFNGVYPGFHPPQPGLGRAVLFELAAYSKPSQVSTIESNLRGHDQLFSMPGIAAWQAFGVARSFDGWTVRLRFPMLLALAVFVRLGIARRTRTTK